MSFFNFVDHGKIEEVLGKYRRIGKQEKPSKKVSLPRVRIYPQRGHLRLVWDADREEKRARSVIRSR